METNNKKQITFNLDNDNRPLLERFDKQSGISLFENSIFKDIYSTALSQIEGYLSALGLQSVDESLESLTDKSNNIFAFIGERGSGKTSCMLSVASILKDKPSFITSKYPKINDKDFYTLGMIDPTYFESERNVVSIFVAKLYSRFVNSQNTIQIISESDKTKLIECFCKTQKHLTALLGNKDSSDDLERLTSYAASVDLKSDIRDLVHAFLKFEKRENAVLLLLIDDIDLNTKEAGKMAELVRKYLIQDNILILMSLKLDQLEAIKRLEYMNEYDTLIKKDASYINEIEEMVDRYIGKFLPHAQRIYLPDVENYMNYSLTITCTMNGVRKSYPFTSVKQAVPQMIFWKTRYLFYNSAQKVSYVVPRNLRELRQLLKMLVFMPDYMVEEGDKKVYNLHNKTTFKKYLFEHWIVNNLDAESRRLFAQILEEENYSLINNTTIRVLTARFKDQLLDQNDKPLMMQDILSTSNTTYNISVGDVLAVIDALEYRCVDEYSQKFLFLVKTLYSIRLYEAYDMVTDKVSEGDDSMEGACLRQEPSDNDTLIKKHDQLEQYSDYEKLVSGILINTDYINLVKLDGNINNSYFYIEKQVFDDLYRDKTKKSEHGQYDSAGINLLELLFICMSRDDQVGYNSSNKSSNGESTKFRESLEFESVKALRRNFIRFDIGAIFFNLHRLDKCYKRYNEGFLEIVKSIGENSLRYKLQQKTIENKQDNVGPFRELKWLSYCSIRNVEILMDFIEHCRQIDYTDTSSFEVILTGFFNGAKTYRIKSYDRDLEEKNENHYDIDFKFLEVLASCMETVKKDEIWKQFDKDRDNESQNKSNTNPKEFQDFLNDK